MLARFDFGLDEVQERRAARLHSSSIIVDMMFWGPIGPASYDGEMIAELERCEREEGLGAAGKLVERLLRRLTLDDAGYQAAWDSTGVTAGSREVDLRAPLADVAKHTAAFDTHDWLVKALRADDIRVAKAAGHHAGFLNTQDVGDLTAATLEVVYDLGLRMIMPTYNSMNHLGSGCTDRVDGGLSTQGVALIDAMNAFGVIADTSHCGKMTTLDMCAVSSAPVIASHTAAKSVYGHARGKSDEELDAIAATDGVVGIVTLPDFLAGGPRVTIEAMLDHIDHVIRRIGWEHVGIGSDWPMAYPDWWIRRLFAPSTWARDGWTADDFGGDDVAATTVGFDDPRAFPNITRGLVARGYPDDQIEGILGGNFLRVFGTVCG